MLLQFYGVAVKPLTLKDCFQPSPVVLKSLNWLSVVLGTAL